VTDTKTDPNATKDCKVVVSEKSYKIESNFLKNSADEIVFKYLGLDETEGELKSCEDELSRVKLELNSHETKPPVVDQPIDEPGSDDSVNQKKMIMDHTNGAAWHDKGIAIVQCMGDPFWDSCTFNGKGIQGEYGKDNGRHTWYLMKSSERTGVITCKYGSQSNSWTIERKMIKGECFQSDR
jgi:hypothetical protein